MIVTTAELERDLDTYLQLAATEDILITREDKAIAKLSSAYPDRVSVARSLFGILPNDLTLQEARDERLSEV